MSLTHSQTNTPPGRCLRRIQMNTPHTGHPPAGARLICWCLTYLVRGQDLRRGVPSNAGNQRLSRRELPFAHPCRDGQPPFDRTSGEGFVAAHDGDYADAQRKRYSVVLFNVESTGAIGPRAVRLLAQLAKDVKRKGATDGTVYGTARTSTRSFFVHHLSAVAAGVMHADALTLENAAASSAFFDTRGAHRAVVRAA